MRAAWDSPTGRSPELWKQLAELGLVGLTVPEEHGGLGLGEVDLVLILEEAGRVALPEPLLETTAIAVPLLVEAGTPEQQADVAAAHRRRRRDRHGRAGWASGSSPTPTSPTWSSAEVDGQLHAVPSGSRPGPAAAVRGRRAPGLHRDARHRRVHGDGRRRRRAGPPRRRRGTAASRGPRPCWRASPATWSAPRSPTSRSAPSSAAPSGRSRPSSTCWPTRRWSAESSRAAVWYAAYAIAHDTDDRTQAAAVAKSYASDAESLANDTALQVHGGIGFTWEHDLHLWLKRGKALERAWGSATWHRANLARGLFGD